MIFFDVSEGMENCKMSGKNWGTLRWMIHGKPDKNIMFLPLIKIV